MDKKEKEQRTKLQNRALHKYYELVAHEFREAGYDMKQILGKHIAIPATPELIKECIWKPIQNSMYSYDSTTQLTTDEISKVYEVLNKHLGEQFGIHVPWPSIEEQMLQDLTS